MRPTSFWGHPFKVMDLSPRIYTCHFTFSTSAETHITTRCPLCHIKPTWNEFHYYLWLPVTQITFKESFSKFWVLGINYNSYHNSLLIIYILSISMHFNSLLRWDIKLQAGDRELLWSKIILKVEMIEKFGREEYLRKGYRVPKGTQRSLSLLGIK